MPDTRRVRRVSSVICYEEWIAEAESGKQTLSLRLQELN